MERDPALAGAPEPARPSHPALALWYHLTDGLAALGTGLILILMLLICADVVARNGFGGSLPLVPEVGAMTVVMIVYLQLAAAIRHDRLARTEVFFESLKARRPRAARLLGALFDAVAAAMFALIAWSAVGILEADYVARDFIGVVGVATLPTWPFRALIALGLTVSALQFVLQVGLALSGREERA